MPAQMFPSSSMSQDIEPLSFATGKVDFGEVVPQVQAGCQGWMAMEEIHQIFGTTDFLVAA